MHSSILINCEKQHKPKSSHVLNHIHVYAFFSLLYIYMKLCTCMKRNWERGDLVLSQQYDPAPGEMREVTIYTKYTLSSALAFPVFFFSLHLSCLRTHTCSQPLTTHHAWVICWLPLIYNFMSGEWPKNSGCLVTWHCAPFIRPTGLHCVPYQKDGNKLPVRQCSDFLTERLALWMHDLDDRNAAKYHSSGTACP